MILKTKLFGHVYEFKSIREVMAKANEEKSGDKLAGIAAETAEERVAAKVVLSNLTLNDLRNCPAVPYEEDEVTRIIQDSVNETIFNEYKNMTVAEFREWLLDTQTTPDMIRRASRGLTSEIVAGVCKLMSNLDLIYAAKKMRVTAHCNTTIGLPGTFSSRLQPNHTTDDPNGIIASVMEGLSLGCGDAVIGLNPVDDSVESVARILKMFDEFKRKWEVPTQICVLAHVTTQTEAANKFGAPLDLMFQSIAGSQKGNEAFGLNAAMLDEGRATMLSLRHLHRTRTSCTLRPARALSFPPRPTTAGTRSPWRPAAMALPSATTPSWSTPSSASSGPSTCTIPSRSPAPAWRITSWAS